MLRLIRSLFQRKVRSPQQAALQQGISVKTIRRMIASELGIKLPIKFLIKKANLIIYRRKQCRLLSYKKVIASLVKRAVTTVFLTPSWKNLR